jgi:hypothetical protein
MHLDLATALNLISALTLIGALIFTGLQVREATRARRDQAAVTVLQTALSENSARMLDLFGEIPENAPAQLINDFDQETKRAILEFGLRLEVIGYMVFRNFVDLETANDLVSGWSSLIGRAPISGRSREGSAPNTVNSSNGANG